MTPNDESRLKHMLEAAEKALVFAHGKTRDDLDQDELLCLGLVRLLEIIGEAASRVSPQLRNQYGTIPWQMIIGMRNRLIYAYDVIDLDILWQTLQQDLQPLVGELKSILAFGSATGSP